MKRKTPHQAPASDTAAEPRRQTAETAPKDADESSPAARKRYLDIYDLAPVAYCTVSQEGLILEANLRAASLLRVDRGALIQQPIQRFILKEDQEIYFRHRKQLVDTPSADSPRSPHAVSLLRPGFPPRTAASAGQTGGQAGLAAEPQACELRMVRHDGAQFWALLEATVAQGPDGARVCRTVVSDITERKRTEEALRERIKELRCLYALADVIAREDNLEQILQGTVELLPSAWLHPEITAARIVLGEHEFKTANFHTTAWRQAADVTLSGRQIGMVELYYLEERPVRDEGPFLREERHLLDAVAEQLGRVIARKRAEEALLVKNWAIESAGGGFAIADLDANLTYVNASFLKMWGYRIADEVLGRPVTEFWATDNVHEVVRVLREEGHWTGEMAARRKDGQPFTVELVGTTVRDPQGSPVCMLGSFSDITERKQTEEALRASEAALRRAQQVAHIGTWAWHIRENRLEWSDEMFCIFGFDREGFTGDIAEVVARAIHPDDRAAVEQSNLSVMRDGKPIPLEYRVVRPDGTERVVWAEAGDLLFDEAGNPDVLSGIVQDITERKRAEAAVRDSEQRHRQLFETMAQGVVYEDADGSITSANPAAERILGLTLDQMCGRTSFDPRWRAVREDGSDYPGEEHPATVALRTGVPVPGAVMGVFHPAENQHRWILVSAIPQFRADETKPYQVYTTFTDITDQREQQALAMRQERIAAIGQLAAGLAHNYNNLFGGLLNYINLLDMIPREADAWPRYMENVRQIIRRAATLSGTMINFSGRRAAGGVVVDLCEEINALRGIIDATFPQSIRIAVVLPPVPVPVFCDPAEIQQVVLNLCLNARDAMPNGGDLILTLTREAVVPDRLHKAWAHRGAHACLRVQDTGCGIAAAHLPHIFEPFYSTKADQKGTGLGLSTVFATVRAFNGYIGVESREGAGAEFVVRLPLASAPPAEGAVAVSS